MSLRFIPVLLLLGAPLFAVQHRGVVSSGGQRIPGALVTAVQGDRKLVTTTDESGQYAFDDLAPGAWTLQVEMFGFLPARREGNIGGVESRLQWELELKPAPGRSEDAAQSGGFQNLTVQETDERELSAAISPATHQEPAGEAHEASEAFLVQGSLSRGLQAVQQEESFEERRGQWAEKVKVKDRSADAGPAGPPVFGERRETPAGGAFPGRLGGKGGIGRGIKMPRSAKPTMARFGNRRKKGAGPIQGMANLSLRNSALDARPYSLTGQTLPKPSYAQSRFGIAAGGLLRIPKVLELQRTFFFASYSGTRSRNPYHAVASLASLAERGGDFSQSAVRGPVAVYDPANRQPFPENRVPASRISAAALGLLEFIPLPNQPGRVQNYQILSSVPQDTDNFSFRLNQPLSRRDRLSASTALQKRRGENMQLYGFRDESEGSGLNSDLGWSHTFRPGSIGNLRFGLNRNRSRIEPFFAGQRDVAGELGIRGTSRDPINYGPPNLGFTNFGGLTDGIPTLRRDQTATVSQGLTFVRGKHSLNAGGDYRRVQLNSLTYANARGHFSFSGLATSGFDERNLPRPFTGFDFADFLLGLPQSSSLRFGGDNTYFRQSAFSVYSQDEWRALPNLTVNVGARYELFAPMREKYGRVSNLDVAAGFAGVAVVTPGWPGPYSGRFPEALIDPDRNNLSPRAGVAWKPNRRGRVVVRAGYGIFYDGSLYTRFATRLASQPPFAQTANLTTSLARPLTLRDGFAASAAEKVTNTFAVDRGYRLGYAQTWNLAIQKEFRRGLVLEAGYLATKGTRLDIQRSPNRAAPGSPLTAEDRRRIGNAAGFTFDSSEGNSIYHAAQVRVTRRLRKGLSANALYTFSKSIDNASSIGGVGSIVAQNDRDLSAERGLSSFDRRHALNLNYILTSPADDRKGAGGGWGARLPRNWQVSGGLTIQSGPPFTARVLGNRADSGGTGVIGSGRADSTGAPIQGGGFFNLTAFTVPAAGRFGNAGRNTIPGPAMAALNASFGRAFRLGESRRWLEFRLESQNVTNRVSFTGLGTVINSLNYGLPTATAPMRHVSLMMRYRF